MPWSGSGVYTRAYGSWTSDASNNLPISATKFDLEDNDFAAGIQNCLTIDGQNKPNATLTWAQTLALTKGTNSTVFSMARTGGSNNPSLSFNVSDAANSVTGLLATGNAAFVFTPTAYTFGNAVDDPTYTFAGPGPITLGGATTNSTASLNIANAGGSAHLSLTDSAAGTNAKIWDLFADSSGILHGRLANDANNSTTDWLAVTRTGFASANVAFPNSVVQIWDNATSPALFNAGYMDAPQNQLAANYGLLLSDRGKSLFHNSVSAHTFTIPANASISFPLGTMIVITNVVGGGNLTIAITSDVLTWANNGSTGSRTLGAGGICVIYKQSPTGWLITGPGLS
jgi:hypothetical protein